MGTKIRKCNLWQLVEFIESKHGALKPPPPSRGRGVETNPINGGPAEVLTILLPILLHHLHLKGAAQEFGGAATGYHPCREYLKVLHHV